MKVLMMGRIGLFEVGGGDKVQIENTAEEVRNLGIDVEIKTSMNVDFSSYDIVHVFQLDWTPETYFYVKRAKAAGKPIILSPIHHSVKELQRYDNEYTFGYRRISKVIFRNQYARDTFKNLYKSMFDFRKLGSTLYSVFAGLKNMQRKCLEMSDVVLVQTVKEAEDLINTYGVDIKWEKVPNGVAEHFKVSGTFENILDFSDYILCVGRIEPRKNQLSIIKAVEVFRQKSRKNTMLVFVGGKNRRHDEYLRKFNREVENKSWLIYLDHVDYQKMPALYKFAKVGVSASWFETTGLTSLEALFCGTNAVASGERAKEYLGNSASYCDPGDVLSISAAIEKEYDAPRPTIDAGMLRDYTWANAAEKTVNIYKAFLK